MTDLRTVDVGIEFLERLLERSERNPDRSRPASAAPEYDRLSTAQQVGPLSRSDGRSGEVRRSRGAVGQEGPEPPDRAGSRSRS
jgi:hypothetical protein